MMKKIILLIGLLVLLAVLFNTPIRKTVSKPKQQYTVKQNIGIPEEAREALIKTLNP